MDNQNKIKLSGIVKKIQSGGSIIVELENKLLVTCYTSGKIKKRNVHIILGDSVDVEISTHDLTKGRIIHRYLVRNNES